VRRAASRYFVVDAAGFTASYDDHHHHHSSPDYPMLPKGSRREEGLAAGEVSGSGPCAACGGVTTKKCSRCKRVRYWCVYSSFLPCPFRACLGISGMNGNEGYWGGGISIITQIFPKSPSILFHPLPPSPKQALQVLPSNGYGAACDIAFLPSSQRNLSLLPCHVIWYRKVTALRPGIPGY
jgi:hypothetical protein